MVAYRRDLRKFFAWLNNRKIPALTVRDLADYVGWLHEKKLAAASLARHIVSLKVFFRYLQLEGVLTENAVELLGSQKLWQRVPEGAVAAGRSSACSPAPMPGDPCWRRDRAMLELLYATGCRASELSNLAMRDVHLDDGFCMCQRQGGQGTPGAAGAASGRSDHRISRTRTAGAGRASTVASALAVVVALGPATASRADLGTGEALFAARGRVGARSARTRCGTVSPRTCWPAAPIYAWCRKCSATPASRRRRSTRTSITPGSRPCTSSFIREHRTRTG